jgi:phenylalanyl-tRNA synthetase beta chain
MNISYNWLKEYVDFDLSAEEVSAALTSIGLEVEGVEKVQTIKGGLEGLVVGEVLTCVAHPNSDHLHITTVNLGSGVPTQIVCGAPNVEARQKVIVAPLGATLYDGDESIVMKKMKLRGVESSGMICAEDEIGLGGDHAGIIVLPSDVQPGTLAKDYYKIKNDWLIEVDITPNRADAVSHYGVARDMYAWLIQNGYQTKIHKPIVDAFAVDNHDLDIDVKIENEEACPRYSGVSMKGVKVGESPEWLKEHLASIGIRSINNIVDITNYIVFELGQPLHCYDADVVGKEVIVKTMPHGTKFVTLDGAKRSLDENDLMVCNNQGPMCIAGVFGGAASGVTEKTTNIFLESAYFHPTWIRKTARRHSLNTDASFRFERGVDPLNQVYVLKRAALLVKELAGGTVSSEIKDVCPKPAKKFLIHVSYKHINDLIGKVIPIQTIKSIVRSLEMDITAEATEGLTLAVPPYRVDVQRECDVVEDILRIYGYNNVEIPASLKSTLTVKGDVDKSYKLQNLVAEQLVGSGFNEIMNNSLTKIAYYASLKDYPVENLVRLLNPLSSDLSVMRQTMLFGGLESVARNINHKSPDLKFFEFGNCYHFHQEKRVAEKILSPYTEDYHLALWLTGNKVSNSWAHKDEESSVYEMKAYVENVLKRVGINLHSLKLEEYSDDIYSSALVAKNAAGQILVTFGVVNAKILKQFDIEQPVYYADINWNTLHKALKNFKVSYYEISKYPAVKRDLAMLVDKDVKFLQIEQLAYNTEKKLLKDVWLFDVYEGKNLEPGKKSYAVSFLLQDENQTLNDKQIDKIMNKLLSSLQHQLDVKLR